MEIEESNCLPFLDTLIIRKQDIDVSHKVYRKKTHTEQYLHALSHHHPQQKVGVMNTLITGAIRISDTEDIEAKKEHLHGVFLSNGYGFDQIRKDFAKTEKPKHLKEKKVGEHKDFLPYIQGVTDNIAKHLKKKSIDYVFSPLNNIRKLLKSVKDPIDPSLKKGVNMILCECGKAYIGETGRSIRTRVKEHYADIRLDKTQKYALAQHSHGTKHPIRI